MSCYPQIQPQSQQFVTSTWKDDRIDRIWLTDKVLQGTWVREKKKKEKIVFFFFLAQLDVASDHWFLLYIYFISQLMFSLFPYLGYCEKYCDGHKSAIIPSRPWFQFSFYIRNGIAGLYGSCMFYLFIISEENPYCFP